MSDSNIWKTNWPYNKDKKSKNKQQKSYCYTQNQTSV